MKKDAETKTKKKTNTKTKESKEVLSKEKWNFIIYILVFCVVLAGLGGYYIGIKTTEGSSVIKKVIEPKEERKDIEKPDIPKEPENNLNDSFKATVTGYVSTKTVTDELESGETKNIVYFNIISTDNSMVRNFIADWQGNTFVSENGLAIGCVEESELIRYNASDEKGNNQYIINADDTTKIMNSTINNEVTLNIEHLTNSFGGGAPLCYSHLTNIELVD